MIAGDGSIRIPTYKENAHHTTQVVKVNDQNEIFKLIVALKVDGCPNKTISISIIMLNNGIQESEPPGHGRYLFFL